VLRRFDLGLAGKDVREVGCNLARFLGRIHERLGSSDALGSLKIRDLARLGLPAQNALLEQCFIKLFLGDEPKLNKDAADFWNS
jgi:hypothetical protein